MNIWRLMGHHLPEYKDEVMRWTRETGVLAVGWGATGDLRHHSFRSEQELASIVFETHKPYHISKESAANGGRSLWRLCREAQIGDLVIVRTNKEAQAMRITGDYFFVGGEYPQHYEHRRKAESVPVDANRLWQFSGGRAAGQNPFLTFLRCTNTITEDDLRQVAR